MALSWLVAAVLAHAPESATVPPPRPARVPPQADPSPLGPKPPPAAQGDASANLPQTTVVEPSVGRHENRDDAFVATIHSDGRVSFRDLPLLRPSLMVMGVDLLTGKVPGPAANGPTNTLVRPSDLGSLGNDMLVYDGGYGPPPLLITLGTSFGGLADLVLSTRRAASKQRFLTDTAEYRAALAEQYRRSREVSALSHLGGELQALWDDSSTPAATRRERLFQRWDECAEAPLDPTADAEAAARGRAGEAARRSIEVLIRRVAPRGSVDAYTPVELADMNRRRRSRARFDPYNPARSN